MPPINRHRREQAYWRSLAEREGSPAVLASLAHEFPEPDPAELTGMPRRDFLRMMSLALAAAGLGLTGCRRWPEKEVRPQASQPEGRVPGVAEFYATMYELGGAATGILAKSFEGRPIKIEGNALHPFSLGAADAFAQASLLELYDPDRTRQPLEHVPGSTDADPLPRPWEDFARFARSHFAPLRAANGKGLAVLSRPTCSPTVRRLREEFLKALPRATWHTYEPLHRDHEIAGAKLAFNQALRPQYHLEQARVIACFDADLLGLHPAHQRYARDWATGRATGDQGKMNRLYAVESAFSVTGSIADERLAARCSRVPYLLAALATKLGLGGLPPIRLDAHEEKWLSMLAIDLQASRTASMVTVGPAQPATAHALAHGINAALGNIGRTVAFTVEPLGDEPGCVDSITHLATALRAGRVATLLILDGNPLYDAPADLNFDPSRAMSIHLSAYHNETSARCRWQLPLAHFLECWGDGRAWDGTYSVQQPLILPLFDGKSPAELLALVLGQAEGGLELVQKTARDLIGSDFQRTWERLLHDGVLAGSAWPAVAVGTPNPPSPMPLSPSSPAGLEIVFVADASVYDGRFGENGWLHEMPDPLTKLTWDNAALIAKSDADALGLVTGQVVRIDRADAAAAIEIPAYVMPGQAPGTIALTLGYGRTRGGRVGCNVGSNVYPLRSAKSSYLAGGARVTATGRTAVLALTQEHQLIDAIGMWGRDERVGAKRESGELIHDIPLPQFVEHPSGHNHEAHDRRQLFDPPSRFNQSHAWGMAIDLNKCIGCSACVVACQVENNIPIVGKEQVAKKREMHWLRIDRYFKGPVESPDVVHAPMACSHCENAPCEQVCPVAATMHDAEGLNTMVYNRCIGTRYCSNNCPFKVRRFNYLDYQSSDPRGPAKPYLGMPDQQQNQQVDPIKRMVFNPDVTVRMRGVMEKCTYCTQRLQSAKIRAKVEHAQGLRPDAHVQDHEVVTACQGACPTQAIVFGNLNDPKGAVAQAHHNARAYEMLAVLNLRTRTHYLAKLRNPADKSAPAGLAVPGHSKE